MNYWWWYMLAGVAIGIFISSAIWLLSVVIPMLKKFIEYTEVMKKIYDMLVIANQGIYNESEDK